MAKKIGEIIEAGAAKKFADLRKKGGGGGGGNRITQTFKRHNEW